MLKWHQQATKYISVSQNIWLNFVQWHSIITKTTLYYKIQTFSWCVYDGVLLASMLVFLLEFVAYVLAMVTDDASQTNMITSAIQSHW